MINLDKGNLVHFILLFLSLFASGKMCGAWLKNELSGVLL
jgi:hypothetical protein